MIKEFKEFISKGNVLDLAIGVVMGTAFSGIVTSLVNDIIMPVVGLIIGGIDFTGLSVEVADVTEFTVEKIIVRVGRKKTE